MSGDSGKKETDKTFEAAVEGIGRLVSDGEIQPPSFAIFIIGKPPETAYLYRGDARHPNVIFKEGFTSKGESSCIESHVFPPDFEHTYHRSGFVATSESKTVAESFPRGYDPDMKEAYVYEINPQRKAISVPDVLDQLLKEGKIDIADHESLGQEQEKAVPKRIKPSDIRGFWPVEIKDYESWVGFEYDRNVSEQFIPNPNHSGTIEQKAWKTATFLGKSATCYAIYVDGKELVESFNKSQQNGDFTPFFETSTKILTAWIGASAGASLIASAFGAVASGVAATVGAPATIAGSVLAWSGLAGGIAGSIWGYIGGAHLGEGAASWFKTLLETEKNIQNNPKLYKDFARPLPLPNPPDPLQTYAQVHYDPVTSFIRCFNEAVDEEFSINQEPVIPLSTATPTSAPSSTASQADTDFISSTPAPNPLVYTHRADAQADTATLLYNELRFDFSMNSYTPPTPPASWINEPDSLVSQRAYAVYNPILRTTASLHHIATSPTATSSYSPSPNLPDNYLGNYSSVLVL